MSTFIRRFIECDTPGCPVQFEGFRDATNVEVCRQARAQGWSKASGTPATGWKPLDWCPDHRGGAS